MRTPGEGNGRVSRLKGEVADRTGLRGHVLIVDDEPNFRFSTGIALRRAGYAITEAENAEQALSLITRAYGLDLPLCRPGRPPSFDLLLVDVQMPGMSGVELIDEVRRRNIGVPIFVVSGFADKRLSDELRSRGCFDLLNKPFEPVELIEKVWTAINAYRNGGAHACPV
jgi:two-component system, NtrC family, C4-dicarboxylate transport response regulator DctD